MVPAFKTNKTKLTQDGFSHIVLPLAVLAVAVGVVAFAGTRIMGSSSAASPNDICGTGYSKKGEHYLKNVKTGEQAHFKVIVAQNGNMRCIYTMGTEAAAKETNYMRISRLYNCKQGWCSVNERIGRYYSRTPTVKFKYGNESRISAESTRNGNINQVSFTPAP